MATRRRQTQPATVRIVALTLQRYWRTSKAVKRYAYLAESVLDYGV